MRPSRRTFILIHVYLAAQMILPASYYLGRADRNDERFAWRMFSPTRLLRCEPTFLVPAADGRGRPATLVGRERPDGSLEPGVFHEAWAGLAQRGRGAVIDAMAEELCRRNPDRAVRVRVACRELDGRGTLLRDGTRDACSPEP